MFGGSFNPPHNAHVEIAARMREEFSLSCVYFVVAADPPHKAVANDVGAQTRLALTRAALAGRDGLEASDIEMLRDGKSYTVDTLRTLRAQHPNARLWLLVGEDMLENLPQWREPEAVFRLATIAAASRPGTEADIQKTAAALTLRYGADIRVAAVEGPEVSSTQVRALVSMAKPISALVPQAVEQLLYEQALYQPQEIRLAQEKLRASLKPARFLHSLGTMRCAIELAARFGFDGEKARLAGLLHDCAKLPGQELLALAARYGVPVDEDDRANPRLLHDRVGAQHARAEYAVRDEQVLAAISCHTRCAQGMDAFARMLYLADKIEPTLYYPGLEEIRTLARTDMDRAVLLCMRNMLAKLEREHRRVQPTIYQTIDELEHSIKAKMTKEEAH